MLSDIVSSSNFPYTGDPNYWVLHKVKIPHAIICGITIYSRVIINWRNAIKNISMSFLKFHFT